MGYFMIMATVGGHDGLGGALGLSASVDSTVQGPPKAGSPPPRRWRRWGKTCRATGLVTSVPTAEGRQTAEYRR